MEAPSSNTAFLMHPSRDFPESVPAIDIVDLVAYAVSKIG
jgi:hypothetical protein